eukprot:Skav220421  [mRNA]  locus=scaffold639:697599:698735:+ [translate_table: standard]
MGFVASHKEEQAMNGMNGEQGEGCGLEQGEEDGGDVESQEGFPEKAQATKPKPCCTQRVMILSILATFAVLVGAVTAAFWPRDVDWNLTKLDVSDESDLMTLVMAFGNVQNDTVLPELVFQAGAAVQNPNFLGGTAAQGEFQVLYRDNVLGRGHSEPVSIPALGSGKVEARMTGAKIRVKLNPALFKQLTADVLEHALHTTVKVKGGATVRSIFGLQIDCRMDCDIHASVSKILGDEKQAVLENKTCRYEYF